ncbi:MAG: tetratricopeptide repeat protein [Pseudomonadota bacterium]
MRKFFLVLLCLAPAAAMGADATDDMAARLFQQQTAIANKGDPAAQYHLGEMYEKALGTERDLDQARLWYTRAAEKGERQAKARLAILDREKTRERDAAERARAQQRSAEAEAREKAAVAARAGAEARARAEAERLVTTKRVAEAESAARARQQAEAEAKAKSERLLEAERATKTETRAATPPAMPVPNSTSDRTANASRPAPDSPEQETKFSSDPCQGRSARLMSTCR